jgi:hypothetical protein
VVAALGPRRALAGAYLLSTAGLGALILADRMWIGVAYAVLAGAGFGAVSPLHGMVGADEFDAGSMGALLGVQAALTSLGSAFGPVVAGVLRDATGSYVPGGLVGVGTGLAGAGVLWWAGRSSATPPMAGAIQDGDEGAGRGSCASRCTRRNEMHTTHDGSAAAGPAAFG